MPATRATPGDLEEIVQAHARGLVEQQGVNPLEADADGFRRRMARLVEQGKVWVWFEGGRLIFKAVVITETPEVTYIEGIGIRPEQRGRGYGSRCVSQLARRLLAATESLVLLVEEQNEAAAEFYRRVGFKRRGRYNTIFLEGEMTTEAAG